MVYLVQPLWHKAPKAAAKLPDYSSVAHTTISNNQYFGKSLKSNIIFSLKNHLAAIPVRPVNERSFSEVSAPMKQNKSLPLVDQRIAGILASARTAFLEKGFDGASMQDVARTAGMSVGNFYRYFPSKAAIVEALVMSDLAEMEQDFAAVLEHADPLSALRAGIAQRITEACCSQDAQLWVEIDAAALRKPEIAKVSARMEDEIVEHLTTIFARSTGQSLASAQLQFTAHARFLVLLVKAGSSQSRDLPEADDLTRLVLRTINQTLDEISLTAQKG
jgi:AcrR family transcriptional regulator